VCQGFFPLYASFTIEPPYAPTGTDFHFDASSSYDELDESSELEVRWDYENDEYGMPIFPKKKVLHTDIAFQDF